MKKLLILTLIISGALSALNVNALNKIKVAPAPAKPGQARPTPVKPGQARPNPVIPVAVKPMPGKPNPVAKPFTVSDADKAQLLKEASAAMNGIIALEKKINAIAIKFGNQEDALAFSTEIHDKIDKLNDEFSKTFRDLEIKARDFSSLPSKGGSVQRPKPLSDINKDELRELARGWKASEVYQKYSEYLHKKSLEFDDRLFTELNGLSQK